MRGQTVAPTGVHVAGNFQAAAGFGADWNPATTPLSDPNGDGIYELLLNVPEGYYFYKFINGTTWPEAELVPLACGLPDGGGNVNRQIGVAPGGPQTMPALAFGGCAPTGPISTTYDTHWWNDAVFYEVFVRSFYDGTGDGKGDFAGLTAKLDYLNDGNPATTSDLGITAIWLMPIMTSPSYHGYDIINFKATEPDYGSMAEFDAFLAAAHARGIKVILDLVLNHTSNQHAWFANSASSPTSVYRDWYRWSATNPGPGSGGRTVWHLRNGAWYYGYFYNGMPDLNWDNADMRAAMWDATRFWLDKGVDGYRLDAVIFLDEDSAVDRNTSRTLDILAEFQDSVRAASPQAFTIGEAWSPTNAVVPYVKNDRLDACFEFDLAAAILNTLNTRNPADLRAKLNETATTYPQLQYGTFLTNHDQNRVFDQLGSSMPRMKQAAALLLTMPGVPFLYYGEEVGMSGTGVDEVKRRPMQWTAGPRAGFTTGTPWEPLNANYAQYNVATMEADPASLLNHYKKLIGLRTTSEILRKGYYLPVTATTAAVPAVNPLLAFARVWQQQAVLTVANVGAAAQNPVVSLAISSLPAGTYDAVDIYSGQAAGTVTVDTVGGFTAWTPTLTSLGANETWVLQLTPQATGVAAAIPTAALNLYPNPATGRVRIELPGAPATSHPRLGVYDLSGRLLRTATFIGTTYDLDVSALPNGPCFVKMTTERTTTVQRLVVAH